MIWYMIGALFLIGLWGLLGKRNLIKKVIAISISNSAVVLFFVYYGSLSGTTAPIVGDRVPRMVDPLPQALMLTAIVVGICVIALALAIVTRIYTRTGTLDMRRIERQVFHDVE
jgi:multicomponent Na+:H+ antiporter subunit C